MKILAARPRLAAAAVLAASALLAAGCTSSITGSPAMSPGVTADRLPSTSQAVPQPAAPGCKVTVGRGVVSMSGSGGRASTSNGVTSFSCRNGPLIAVGPIADAGISLSVDGAAAMTIAPGASGAVGPYQISVISISAGTAMFQVTPPS